MITKRRTLPFVNARELLLVFDTFQGRPYIRESNVLGNVVTTAAEAIKGLDACKFVRFDTETNRGEDVTEECAEAYLKDFDGEPTSAVPEFVEFSEAWERWSEGYYSRDRAPEYSTHNVVSLGLKSNIVSFRPVR
jgi:hypothetical protein